MHGNLIILTGEASLRMKKRTLSENLTEEQITQASKRIKGSFGLEIKGRPLLSYLFSMLRELVFINILVWQLTLQWKLLLDEILKSNQKA